MSERHQYDVRSAARVAQTLRGDTVKHPRYPHVGGAGVILEWAARAINTCALCHRKQTVQITLYQCPIKSSEFQNKKKSSELQWRRGF